MPIGMKKEGMMKEDVKKEYMKKEPMIEEIMEKRNGKSKLGLFRYTRENSPPATS